MQLKTLSKQMWIVIIFVEFSISSSLLFYLVKPNLNLKISRQVAIKSSPIVKSIIVTSTPELPIIGLPLRLKIPQINVDAAIENVGIDSGGAMEIPKNQEDVAWFQLGQRPGESGVAVIDGHYGWKSKKASAFDNLHKLRVGDKIEVEDDQGMTTTFVVRENRRYEEKADASTVFVSNDGKSHLNLITCEGDWDKVAKSYPNRLVVFADKE